MIKAEMLDDNNKSDFMLKLSRATDADVVVPAPEGMDYFPFQRAGVLYASLAEHVLFGDPPGLGKTVQSIGVMNYDGIDRALILCPASITSVWETHLNAWHLNPGNIMVLSRKNVDRIHEANFLIMSYGLASNLNYIKQVLANFDYSLMVLDEFHFLKNPKAKRTKHVLAKNGLRSKVKKSHCISGTPLVNRPIEMYPAIKTFKPELINHATYFSYGLKYCAGHKSTFGWNFSGASNLPELGRRLRSGYMVRRKKKDVLKDLPDKTISVVYLNTDPKTKKLANEYKDFNLEELKGHRTNDVEFEHLATHRRELGVASAPFVVDYVKTQLECGHDKILVYAHHTEVLDIIKEGLSEFGLVEIRGSTPSALRGRAVECFQGNKGTRVFLGSITAAGVGLTLHASSYVIFAEPSYVPGENEQVMDRVHRIGQKNHVLVEFLVQKGSLNERILKKVLKKQENIDEVLE